MVPNIIKVDHIHVCVENREAAAEWYDSVLGFKPVERLLVWATETGPLTVADAGENVCIALFKREKQNQENRATVAISVSGTDFIIWEKHLKEILKTDLKVYDLSLAWSIFIEDPDGNPYEITSYDYDDLSKYYK